MPNHFSFDAYTPAEIARRIATVGVSNGRMSLLPLLLLKGDMAGALIGLGAMAAFIVLPITAFVAAGCERSIANTYISPLALLLQHFSAYGTALASVTLAGAANNLIAVIVGNLVGGNGLVA